MSYIVRETAEALWNRLSPEFLSMPTGDQWLTIADEFWRRWQFPNCLGAIDGKHVRMQAPPKAGSLFYNYKHYHSIVLLAICDAHYRFTVVDVGAAGSQSDSGVFENSRFGSAFLNDRVKLPLDRPLPGSDEPNIPMGFLGDPAFPLRHNLWRPYPGKHLPTAHLIFNYRQSRGRRVIENAFGILVARWRIYKREILASIDTVELIVKATICLHNYLLFRESTLPIRSRRYNPPDFVDTEDSSGVVRLGDWRSIANDNESGILNLPNAIGHNYSYGAAQVRNVLTQFFMSPVGELQWQYNYVNRGREPTLLPIS